MRVTLLSRRSLPLLLCCAAALGLAAAFSACLSPTEVRVTISTDVQCKDLGGVTVTVATPGAIDSPSSVPTATSASCDDATGSVGSIVLVPAGSSGSDVVVKVVGGFGAPAAECVPPYGPKCIVSRRSLRYIPHTPLTLPIVLEASCVGVPCDANTTCVHGMCVPSRIPDSTSCESPTGCDNAHLYPDAGVADGQAPTDSGGPDGSTVTIAGCGDVSGLQAGAPWPMFSYCPAHIDRSPYRGPVTSPKFKWSFGPLTGANGNQDGHPPLIAADGTLYYQDGLRLVALTPAGTKKWEYPLVSSVGGTAAIAADGSLVAIADDGTVVAIDPSGNGKPIFSVGAIATASAPTIGGPTIYFAFGTKLYAIDRAGAPRWPAFDTGSAVTMSPSIGPDGTVYLGSATTGLFAINPSTGKTVWSAPGVTAIDNPTTVAGGLVITAVVNSSYVATTILAFDAKTGTQTWKQNSLGGSLGFTVIGVGPDGNLVTQPTYVYSLAPADGGLRWQGNVFGAAGWAVVDTDGTSFAGTPLSAIAGDGGVLWSTPADGGLASVGTPSIGADGTLYYKDRAGAVWAFGP